MFHGILGYSIKDELKLLKQHYIECQLRINYLLDTTDEIRET